jgi:hypothetical protein
LMRAKNGLPSSSSRVNVEPSEPWGLLLRSRSLAELSGLIGLWEKAIPGLLISGTPGGAFAVGDERASQMELMLVEGEGSLSNTHRVSCTSSHVMRNWSWSSGSESPGVLGSMAPVRRRWDLGTVTDTVGRLIVGLWGGDRRPPTPRLAGPPLPDESQVSGDAWFRCLVADGMLEVVLVELLMTDLAENILTNPGDTDRRRSPSGVRLWVIVDADGDLMMTGPPTGVTERTRAAGDPLRGLLVGGVPGEPLRFGRGLGVGRALITADVLRGVRTGEVCPDRALRTFCPVCDMDRRRPVRATGLVGWEDLPDNAVGDVGERGRGVPPALVDEV